MVVRRTGARHADGMVTGVASTLFGKGDRSRSCDGFYFEPKRKLNQTEQRKIYFHEKYVTNKGQIRILRVCVIDVLQIIYHTQHINIDEGL